MNMKKLCQGAVIFTVFQAHGAAFAEPRDLDIRVQKDAKQKLEESRLEPKSDFADALLPDSVKNLVDRISHSGNQPIC